MLKQTYLLWLFGLALLFPLAQAQSSTLQFHSATYSVNENGGTVTITVTRVGSEGAVCVDYVSSDDTATAGDDYVESSGTLCWNDGDDSDKTFTVDIIDDAICEGDETFNMTLQNPIGGATIGNPSTAVVTIIDDDCGMPSTLQFSSATYNVNENGGTVTITVTRVGGSEGAVCVDYASSYDTATAGEDYVESSGTLCWSDGDDSDKTFTVDIIDDAICEGDETFILSLSNPTGGAIGNPDTAVVTIIDDDCLDHFKCYSVKGKKIKAKVDLEDQFGEQKGVKIVKPVMLCNPVIKRHNEKEFPVNNPDAHLVCYKIKPSTPDKTVIVKNQFGEKQK
ncbi:MAG: Calx-beta domain-containing protein, partial [Pseudomonadota bacterium]